MGLDPVLLTTAQRRYTGAHAPNNPGHAANRKWNPLCVVLPCHRVVASSGALTAYSGGLAAKEYLLALESRP